MENRISQLESLMAHQDKKIEELNEIVTRQWEEIDALKKYVKLSRQKIAEMESQLGEMNDSGLSVTDIARAEKPPHY